MDSLYISETNIISYQIVKTVKQRKGQNKDDICTENNITSMKQAFECKKIWSLDNGISLCYGCHKNIEKIRTELKM
jgi:hypothetical protein